MADALEWLLAVHDANHAPVFAEHGADDWLMRHRRPVAPTQTEGRSGGHPDS